MPDLRPGDDLQAVLDTLECPEADYGGDLDFIDVGVLDYLQVVSWTKSSGYFQWYFPQAESLETISKSVREYPQNAGIYRCRLSSRTTLSLRMNSWKRKPVRH